MMDSIGKHNAICVSFDAVNNSTVIWFGSFIFGCLLTVGVRSQPCGEHMDLFWWGFITAGDVKKVHLNTCFVALAYQSAYRCNTVPWFNHATMGKFTNLLGSSWVNWNYIINYIVHKLDSQCHVFIYIYIYIPKHEKLMDPCAYIHAPKAQTARALT